MKSFIILCGGQSKRMGRDKGSIALKGKPMILHVMDTISDLADEIILVLRDEKQIKDYRELFKGNYNSLKIVTDKTKDQGPLMGILTGLSNISSDYAQVLPCDSPFISRNFISKMFKTAEIENSEAIVPKWNDGHIEPLHSIYKKTVLNTIHMLIKEKRMDVKSLIQNINVKYVDISQLDVTGKSFLNINTAKDL